MLRQLRFAAALVVAGLAISAAGAATYHVRPDGNNSNPGTSAASWRTLQHAANTVGPGDTVVVHDGTYAPFHITASGTSAARIVFVSQSRHGAVIQGSENFDGRKASIHISFADYITVEGFKVLPTGEINVGERGIRATGWTAPHGQEMRGLVIRNNLVQGSGMVGIGTAFAEGAILEGNEVSGSARSHGIYVANSADGPVIRDNILHHNGKAGLQINGDIDSGGDGVISDALVERNVVYENDQIDDGSGAFNFDAVKDATIRNNLLYDNHGQGIVMFQSNGNGPRPTGNKVLNNTIIQAPDGSAAIRLKNGATGAVVRNNIAIHRGSGASLDVRADSYAGLVSDNNIFTRIDDTDGGCCISLNAWRENHPGQDAGSIQAPSLSTLFMSAGNDDYHLAAGSPAINLGAGLPEVTDDLERNPRPQGPAPEAGAYETATGGTSSAPPPSVGDTLTRDDQLGDDEILNP